MGFFRRLKNGVKNAVHKVAKKVSRAIEKAGNAAADAAKRLGESVAQNVPIIGPALGAVVGWAGRVTSGICDFAATLVNGAAAGLIAASELILGGLGGLVTGDWDLMKEGLIGFVANLFGGALIAVGGFISLVQTVFGAQSRKRALTDEEDDLIALVFRKSLDRENIRLVKGRAGSGVYAFTNRPFTMGNIIYMKDTAPDDWLATLVHECVHVWQYQHNGSRYSADALGAAVFLGKERAYQWWKEPTPWTEFNAEAQAEIFEDMFVCGELRDATGAWTSGDGVFFKGDAVTPNRFRFSESPDYPCLGDKKNPLQDYTLLGNETTDYVRSQPT